MKEALLMHPWPSLLPAPAPSYRLLQLTILDTYCLLANPQEQGQSSPSSPVHHVGEPKVQLKVGKCVFERGLEELGTLI